MGANFVRARFGEKRKIFARSKIFHFAPFVIGKSKKRKKKLVILFDLNKIALYN